MAEMMEKNFNPKENEADIYKMWEDGGYFKPNLKSTKKPFTILLPPPNASGKMHTGNVLMIAIEDLLIRWHRMRREPTLWVPGTDHAGTETQITFERELKKQGKSRFDFTRSELYRNIWDFVQNNKGEIDNQIRRMGASVDWSRYTFALDPKVINTVYDTFIKLNDDGLLYRDDYLVNFCPLCGTTYADIEIEHKERADPLYYIKYQLVEGESAGKTHIVVATTRPETIMVDTHLAVNPKDKKKAGLVGRKVLNPITNEAMEIITDPFVDPKFGTGIVKLTPAHDKNDFEVAKKHKLPVITLIDLNGKLNERGGKYAGLYVKKARERILEDLKGRDLIEKIDGSYQHSISLCKAGHEIEPESLPNWFVKVDKPGHSFKKPALDAVKNGEVKIYPKWREKTYIRWMENMYDWPISRQNVWGIRIPVYYDVSENPELFVTFLSALGEVKSGTIKELLEKYGLEEIRNGLQKVMAAKNAKFVISKESPGENFLPETDTFDTWFSSGQWPLVTLGYPDSEDFKLFYPTSVLETGWEIITKWVSRMIMFGIYLTGKPPFEAVYLHGIVMAMDGRKMSKSLGNIINPEEYIEQYGVDALRMGLISGTANGKDFSFPKDKIVGYRNFANKLWNMGRFLQMMEADLEKESEGNTPNFPDITKIKLGLEDREILNKLEKLIKTVDRDLEKFWFAQAGESIYQFMWHELADVYLEHTKKSENRALSLAVFRHCYLTGIKLLHPFMPFVTEAIYAKLSPVVGPLITTAWPGKAE